MNFIKSHKIACGVVLICLILFVVAGMAFYKMMFPSSADDANGDRLVDAVNVDEAVVNQIIGEIEKNEHVLSAKYIKNVRIVKFIITTKEGNEAIKSRGLTSIITDKLSDEVLGYYDVEVYITQENNIKDSTIGYLFKGKKEFSWDGAEVNE